MCQAAPEKSKTRNYLQEALQLVRMSKDASGNDNEDLLSELIQLLNENEEEIENNKLNGDEEDRLLGPSRSVEPKPTTTTATNDERKEPGLVSDLPCEAQTSRGAQHQLQSPLLLEESRKAR